MSQSGLSNPYVENAGAGVSKHRHLHHAVLRNPGHNNGGVVLSGQHNGFASPCHAMHLY